MKLVVDLSDREMKLLVVAVQFSEKMAAFVPGTKAVEFVDLRKKIVCAQFDCLDAEKVEV